MSRFISHAQNFEDVMLWRALGRIKHGTYVDVGAQDPFIDSVSLAFYQRGWRGMHVEPSPYYAAALREGRPDEAVVEAAVGAQDGSIRFCEMLESGLSSGDAGVAKHHRAAGLAVHETVVPSCTLDDVLRQVCDRPIHWMKINVEGMELEALRGWTIQVRPWVVLIGSTEPNSPVQSHQAWEMEIVSKGYDFVYFDGLNRFYVSQDHPELKAFFGYGPNVFDDFALSGTAHAPFCALLNEKVRQAETVATDLRLKLAHAEANATDLSLRLSRNVAKLADAQARISGLSLTVEQKVHEVYRITGSRSWKVSRPLRTFSRLAERAVLKAKRLVNNATYRAWLALRRCPAKAVLRVVIGWIPPLEARLYRMISHELSLEPRGAHAESMGLDTSGVAANALASAMRQQRIKEILARVEHELEADKAA